MNDMFRFLKMPGFLGAVLGTFFGVPGAVFGASGETLKLIRTIPHSGYSEGLDYHAGFLWNALPKELLKIDPKDGSVVFRYTPATDYSESLAWFQGALWNLSFSNDGLYRGTLKGKQFQFTRKGAVPEVHGWGLTHNGKELIATGDYSAKLYFFSPDGKLVRTLNTDQTALEDLAWDGQGIWASSFTTHRGKIFRLDPVSGKSSALYSLPDPEACPIIDGIAVQGKGLWITGKECPLLYYFEMPTPSLKK